MDKIPRIDVGYSAMVAAIVGLLSLAVSTFLLGIPANPVALATLPVLAVTAGMGLVAYLIPKQKELWGTIAGVVIVFVEAFLSARRGDIVDVGTVTAALTFVVQALLLYALPRLQVIVNPNGPDQVRRETV